MAAHPVSPEALALLQAAVTELQRLGFEKSEFTVEMVLELVQGHEVLGRMKGKRNLFEFLIAMTDDELRSLVGHI